MINIFWEREASGENELARVTITDRNIEWSSGSRSMKDLLAGRRWWQLNDQPFDLMDPEHYAQLPYLITGSRLWVTAKS